MHKKLLSLRSTFFALTIVIAAPSAFAAPAEISTAPQSAAVSQGTEDGAAKVRELLTEARELIKADKFQEALPVLESALKYDPNPNSASVHQNLGVLYQKLGSPEKAAVQYQEALKLRPTMYACTLNLGQCFLAMGENNEAVKSFKQYVKLQPDSPHVPAVKQMIASLVNLKNEGGRDVDGKDYLESAEKSGSYRWAASKLPLRVFIEDGKGVSGAKASYQNFVSDAFDQWAAASGDRIAWTRVFDKAQADIVCGWSDDLQFIGQSEDAGQTDIASQLGPDGTRIIQHVRLAVLTITADGKALPEQEVKRTCLHEVGHALGLKEHSPNGGDVMFFSDAPSTTPALSQRDQATIARLYDSYPVLTARQPAPRQTGSGKRG
jgi:Tfp pilus assembly protein PilF